jgi:urease accessory protein
MRAHRRIPSGHWPRAKQRGTITLAYDDRHRRRMRLTTDEGQELILDLAQAVALADGDGLMLEEGDFVAVKAAEEEIVEITAAPDLLMRLAWHIGNRHFPAQIETARILIRDDHVMVDLVEGLGGRVRRIRAPFNPEGGAYAVGGHGHDHGHDHSLGDGHDHDHS